MKPSVPSLSSFLFLKGFRVGTVAGVYKIHLGLFWVFLKRQNRREFRNQTVLVKQNNEFLPSMRY